MKLIEDLKYLRQLRIVNGKTKYIFIKGLSHLHLAHFPEIEGINTGQLAELIVGKADIDEAVKILVPEIDPHKKEMLLNDILYAHKRR